MACILISDLGSASPMPEFSQKKIARFLEKFGLSRELNEKRGRQKSGERHRFDTTVKKTIPTWWVKKEELVGAIGIEPMASCV